MRSTVEIKLLITSVFSSMIIENIDIVTRFVVPLASYAAWYLIKMLLDYIREKIRNKNAKKDGER